MSDYYISQISHSDKTAIQGVTALLQAEEIRLDTNLDYTCGMYDDEMNIIATESCFGYTLRCLAVGSDHQGEGLMNQIISHLIEVQFNRGNTHLFLYTKCSSAKFFGDLGFYEIARIDGQIVFMENRRTGFKNYLKKLKDSSALQLQTLTESTSATNRKVAARENDLLHLFIVSEDASLVPFKVRKQLVMEGTAHLDNICYHDSGPYIISNATFPSYFQKDENAVIESHAMLDLTVFTEIARTLGINRRYVGEEPTSLVTGIYNNIMSEKLPGNGIECVIVPRKTDGEKAISASTVRQAIKDNDMNTLKKLVPESTLRYFESEEAKDVIARIRNEENVIHY